MCLEKHTAACRSRLDSDIPSATMPALPLRGTETTSSGSGQGGGRNEIMGKDWDNSGEGSRGSGNQEV